MTREEKAKQVYENSSKGYDCPKWEELSEEAKQIYYDYVGMVKGDSHE